MPDYAKLREQLSEALGPNYKVWHGTYDPCDTEVELPHPHGGSITVCFQRRRWCPGGCLHAGSGLRDEKGEFTWFGVHQINPERYKGRGWTSRLAEDIKLASLNGVEDLIQSHPEWLRGTSPEDARLGVR